MKTNQPAQRSGQRLALQNERIPVRVRLFAVCRGELPTISPVNVYVYVKRVEVVERSLRDSPLPMLFWVPPSHTVLLMENDSERKPRQKKNYAIYNAMPPSIYHKYCVKYAFCTYSQLNFANSLFTGTCIWRSHVSVHFIQDSLYSGLAKVSVSHLYTLHKK